MSIRAGRAEWRNGYYYAIEKGHRSIGTQIPIDLDDALTERCRRARETKRDVLASMVDYFIDNESEFDRLVEDLRSVPRQL